MIGGALARPCLLYPDFFSPGSIWERYPYLLPNLFSAVAVSCGVIIGLLFLEETHPEKKFRRDRGVELGNYLVSLFSRKSAHEKLDDMETASLLSQDDQLPSYRTRENSPQLACTVAPDVEAQPLLDAEQHATGYQATETESSHITYSRSATVIETEKEQKIFTRPVVFNIISYGILAL